MILKTSRLNYGNLDSFALRKASLTAARLYPCQQAGLLRGQYHQIRLSLPLQGGLEDLKKARHYLEKLIERQEVKELVKRPT